MDNNSIVNNEVKISEVENSEVEIIAATEELLPHFKTINEEWISDMFELEETDKQVLDQAKELILDNDGIILFAKHSSLGIVGTCALLKRDNNGYELTKMGVLKSARGLKIGEHLLKAVIDLSKQMNMSELFLLTNKRCEAAIHLYYKNGFRDDEKIMRQYGPLYRRCDVAMSLVN